MKPKVKFGDMLRARWLTRLEPMPETVKAYMAGLIDGEAYVHITKSSTKPTAKTCRRGVVYNMGIDIRMTDRRPLDFIVQQTGIGRVREVKLNKLGNRIPWRWCGWSQQAAALLMCVRPYLVVKAEQGDACLAFQNAMRSPGPQGFSDTEWALREHYWQIVKKLNYGSGRGKWPEAYESIEHGC